MSLLQKKYFFFAMMFFAAFCFGIRLGDNIQHHFKNISYISYSITISFLLATLGSFYEFIHISKILKK